MSVVELNDSFEETGEGSSESPRQRLGEQQDTGDEIFRITTGLIPLV